MAFIGPGKKFKQRQKPRDVSAKIPKNESLAQKRSLPTKSKHTLKNFKDFKSFKRMLDFTLSALFPEIPVEDLREDITFIAHLYQSKGPEFVVRYLKATHESIEHLVLKLTGTLEHEKVSIGKDRSGWPKWLRPRLKSKVLDHKDPAYIRYVLTLCSTRRLITVPTFTNLESITMTPSFKPGVVRYIQSKVERDIGKHAKMVTKSPIIGSEIATTDEQIVTTHPTPALEISLKAGPNGVSMFNFPWDRAAILSHNLKQTLLEFAKHYYSGDIEGWFEEKLTYCESLVDSNRQLNVGKISHTFEGGKLKPRIFAIVDSLTQSLLAPFHRDLMRILATIKEDCTFDHTKVADIAKELYLNKHRFYGYADLSNASDAIPKELYAGIGNRWKPGFGDSWVQLFNRDFLVPALLKEYWDPRTKQLNSVRYNTGQPMGALSSWAFMAYVHHTIVWAAFGSRENARGNYLLLGDDIVIFDRLAYMNYCRLLEGLGISYTNNFSTEGFEFAKRVFLHGREITGAYTAALWASRNVPELFAMEWRTLASRGYKSGSDLPETFRVLLRTGRKRFYRCKLLMTVPYGTEIPLETLAHFCNQITGRSSCFLIKGDNSKLVEAVKAFRQAAAILIQQQFQKLLNEAKMALEANAEEFIRHFKNRSGLNDQLAPIMHKAINEYLEDGKTRIRYLEKDMKLTYLGRLKETKTPTGEKVTITVPPSDEVLLRPNLPQLPRLINFSRRDKHVERLRFRAHHQISIINMLRG